MSSTRKQHQRPASRLPAEEPQAEELRAPQEHPLARAPERLARRSQPAAGWVIPPVQRAGTLIGSPAVARWLKTRGRSPQL